MLLEQLINGLTIGSIYALIALGYSMVYGILKIINFAHGDIFMLGTFMSLTMIKVFHLPFIPAFIISMAATGAVGIVIERIAYRPLRMADRMAPLLSAMGVSIVLANFAQILWGTETHPFPQIIQVNSIELAGVIVTNLQIYILLMSVVLMIFLQLLVNKSTWGVAMRATSYNKETARLMGINVDRIISLTFAVGSALAAAAGIMVGLYYDAVYPTMGYTAGLKAFTAAVLGGIGSIPGAMLGGLLLGVGENFGAAYLDSGYRDAIAFGILVIILLVKPSGLMGKEHQQKV